jgi:hypothetical protein
MNATVVFAEVKAILDQTMADWKAKHGRDPDLVSPHDTTSFSFGTAEELKNTTALGLKLIQPEVIGQNKGDQANLVIALTTGVAGNPRMPFGGPFRTPGEVQVIVDWINGGCLP